MLETLCWYLRVHCTIKWNKVNLNDSDLKVLQKIMRYDSFKTLQSLLSLSLDCSKMYFWKSWSLRAVKCIAISQAPALLILSTCMVFLIKLFEYYFSTRAPYIIQRLSERLVEPSPPKKKINTAVSEKYERSGKGKFIIKYWLLSFKKARLEVYFCILFCIKLLLLWSFVSSFIFWMFWLLTPLAGMILLWKWHQRMLCFQ